MLQFRFFLVLYLGVSLPGNSDALTQFAEEGDGRLCAGNQRSFLLWTQVVVI